MEKSMNRRIKTLLLISMLCIGTLMAGILCACKAKRPITVIFRADGSDNIIISSIAGEAIVPPEVPEKKGNRGYWDYDGSWNIVHNMTINAKYETIGLRYIKNSENGYIVDKGTMDPETVELYIPTEYFGVPVEEIAEFGFSSSASNPLALRSAILPEGMKYLDQCAFQGCKTLCSVNLPETLVRLGPLAFEGTGLTEITIPENVNKIENSAFAACRMLKSVILPPNLMSLGQSAFFGCESLTSVTLPKNLRSIPDSLLGGCHSLKSIEIPKNVSSIGEWAFSTSALETITLPNKVTIIGNYAFASCSSLKTINLPSGLVTIGDNAFSACTSLETIDLPDGVATIGSGAFESCSSLETIDLPDGVAAIGSSAFADCSSLKSIKMPTGGKLTLIDELTFFGCTALESINIPNGVTCIRDFVFGLCSSLMSITIPATVTTMGWAFPGWEKPQVIYVQGYKERPAGWALGWDNSVAVIWDA